MKLIVTSMKSLYSRIIARLAATHLFSRENRGKRQCVARESLIIMHAQSRLLKMNALVGKIPLRR